MQLHGNFSSNLACPNVLVLSIWFRMYCIASLTWVIFGYNVRPIQFLTKTPRAGFSIDRHGNICPQPCCIHTNHLAIPGSPKFGWTQDNYSLDKIKMTVQCACHCVLGNSCSFRRKLMYRPWAGPGPLHCGFERAGLSVHGPGSGRAGS